MQKLAGYMKEGAFDDGTDQDHDPVHQQSIATSEYPEYGKPIKIPKPLTVTVH